mmetsp:Transcript_25132/g.49469  ORF Transcript_25132/g.49469 Transcript_25132/m.49469 type:complete len:90 (-) Transcript_25132:629-898(-)
MQHCPSPWLVPVWRRISRTPRVTIVIYIEAGTGLLSDSDKQKVELVLKIQKNFSNSAHLLGCLNKINVDAISKILMCFQNHGMVSGKAA